MKTCPHCDASLPNLAEQCPQCRQYVAERRTSRSDLIGASSGPEWPGVSADPVPDYRGYLGLGAGVVALGMLIALSGENGAAVLGLVLLAAGGVPLLIGIVGCGVYVGLRQHTDWLESRGD
jgi:hypothetical protein